MQNFISHFHQYILVDPSSQWGWQGVNHWFSYDADFDITVILETEFHENDNIRISHPDKHKQAQAERRFYYQYSLYTHTN